MKYDIRGPAGNIFSVLGMFRGVVKQMERFGIDTTEHKKLIKEKFKSMEYDEILDEIERLTNGSIEFTGRNKST